MTDVLPAQDLLIDSSPTDGTRINRVSDFRSVRPGVSLSYSMPNLFIEFLTTYSPVANYTKRYTTVTIVAHIYTHNSTIRRRIMAKELSQTMCHNSTDCSLKQYAIELLYSIITTIRLLLKSYDTFQNSRTNTCIKYTIIFYIISTCSLRVRDRDTFLPPPTLDSFKTENTQITFVSLSVSNLNSLYFALYCISIPCTIKGLCLCYIFDTLRFLDY